MRYLSCEEYRVVPVAGGSGVIFDRITRGDIRVVNRWMKERV